MGTVLPAVHGRINDLDSHVQVPISRWGEVFGEVTAHFGERFAGIDLFDATDEPELMAVSRRLRERLQRRPSEVFVDQVRVAPFFWERTARQIERYGLGEVYAFSTDFPHPEGGTDPIGRMAADIEVLGDDAVDAFVVRNAELLLPA